MNEKHNQLLNATIEVPHDDIAILGDYREKVLAGQELSSEQYAIVIESLRRSRTAATQSKARGKGDAGAKAGPKSEAAQALDDLFKL